MPVPLALQVSGAALTHQVQLVCAWLLGLAWWVEQLDPVALVCPPIPGRKLAACRLVRLVSAVEGPQLLQLVFLAFAAQGAVAALAFVELLCALARPGDFDHRPLKEGLRASLVWR